MQAPKTYYDSPARSDEKLIKEEAEIILNEKVVREILEGFPELAVILDDNRQIVACNSKAISEFGKKNEKEILGSRIGEAIRCIHRDEMGKDSCGTSTFCVECGAAHAIKFTRENRKSAEEECRITSDLNDNETSFDFNVSTSPLRLKNRNFTLFAIRDISGDKRRQALERIFFHDVLNTASVVNGVSQVLDDADDDEFEALVSMLKNSSHQLIEEIQMQRDLRSAEDGRLEVEISDVNMNDVLKRVHSLYVRNQLTEGKNLSYKLIERKNSIKCDERLLVRSFGNLVKNAIEASKQGDEIQIWAESDENKTLFNVHNPAVIPNNIQVQIFKRSFSTKGGSGRGIGTYSVKLLVEQYLGGKVYFKSREDLGTTFTIELMKNNS